MKAEHIFWIKMHSKESSQGPLCHYWENAQPLLNQQLPSTRVRLLKSSPQVGALKDYANDILLLPNCTYCTLAIQDAKKKKKKKLKYLEGLLCQNWYWN